jgi:hypothetical protein
MSATKRNDDQANALLEIRRAIAKYLTLKGATPGELDQVAQFTIDSMFEHMDEIEAQA